MVDLFNALSRYGRPAVPDVNIPAFGSPETSVMHSWAGTADAAAFLALLVGPLIVINGAWQTPAGGALLLAAFAAAGRTRVAYRRLRLI
ncbi:hypothetical protein ACIRVI_00145 [[Kitasatospora] papulosa]|uniref:hypothetical protein n=1 Tax=Streptomyces TaxID=1883 RepID=UPI0025B2C935|nr:hypothetical protein [Streptomyces sp. P9-2B-1]WJY35438.1 hypothetical protein QTO28_32355 [Streptomyces sp. P9-2B-1]